MRNWLKSAKIQSSHRCCFLGLVSFVSTIAFAYYHSYTLIMDNITKYNEFCAKEEAKSGNEELVA